MLATKQFKSALGLIRKYDESMKSTLSACYAYCLFQWHNGKNRNPHGEFIAVLNEAKGFLSEIAPKLTLGKRDAALDEAQCLMCADIVIGNLFRGREAKKAERAEAKKARDAEKAKLAEQNAAAGEVEAEQNAAAGEVEAEQNAAAGEVEAGEVEAGEVEVEAVEVEHALVVDGAVVVLSHAEAIAMRDYLTTLRAPLLKVA